MFKRIAKSPGIIKYQGFILYQTSKNLTGLAAIRHNVERAAAIAPKIRSKQVLVLFFHHCNHTCRIFTNSGFNNLFCVAKEKICSCIPWIGKQYTLKSTVRRIEGPC